jgi:ankyrin repeat protein
LWLAARFAELPIARALAEGGADPQAAIADNTPPLLAAIVPPPSMAAARDRRDRYLYPTEAALLSADASERETLDTVTLLMSLGARPDAVNQAGNTAMHLAAQAGYHSVIKVLASAGVSLNEKNKRGLTPLGVVTGAGRVPTAASVNAGTMGGDAAIAAVRLKSTADLLRSLGATE